ncbi:MAG: VCBS repeat-containing protein [Cyclobacteriaceae bacterium]|nr:VCBS repeat-containing protein [Cyclobacteriaceae bacterium]
MNAWNYLLCGIAVCGAVALQPIYAQVTFQMPPQITLPATPEELAKGDFNNDGRIDFVACHFNNLANQQITLMLNTGTGTFAGSNKRNFAASTYLTDIATGDFNKDGNLDVVACSQQNNNFSLLLGDGTGNLAAPINFAAGDTPQGIAVGDMNKDSNLDVIVSNRGTLRQVYIYFGNGAGGFSAPTVIDVTNVYDVAVADFNNDTNPDFVVSTGSNAQVWFGNGSGTAYTPGPLIGGFAIAQDIIAANVDGDNDVDIIAGGGYALNDGSGTFSPRVAIPQTNYEYTVADLNGDAHPDIIVNDNNQNYTNIRIYMGNGLGTFSLLGKFETATFCIGIEIADVNNDSHLDIVGVGGAGGGTYFADVLLGDGTGYFTNTIIKYPTTTDPRDIVKGDFNEDGQIDVALCHSTTNIITIYLGQGSGKFSKTTTNYATGTFPNQLAALDYNKDGHLDLAVVNTSSSTVGVYTGAGNGTFTLLANYPVTTTGGGRLAVADFNKDSFIDIAVSGGTNNLINLLTGTGSGFNANVTFPVSANVGDIKAADFNGDGNPDLVLKLTPNSITMFFGNGAGSFTEAPTSYPVDASFILAEDFNNDGKIDVIAFASGGFNPDFLTNDGAGNFSGSSIAVSLGGTPLAYVDMDGDGIKDLVVGAQNTISSEPGSIRIYKGTATGFSATLLANKTYSGGNRLVIHDINNDGKPDIIATSFNIYEDYVGTLINTTGPAACTPPTITSVTNSFSVCAGSLATFSVAASGTPSLTYQWRINGTPIAGATGANYSITAVQPADAGTYSVIITNGCGTITSANIVVTVNTCGAQPVIAPVPLSTQPGGIIVIDLKPLITTPSNNLDLTALQIVIPPASGAQAIIDANGFLTIDYYGILFTGSESITIRACDQNGNCTLGQFEINVATEIKVYNAVSILADGKNDFFRIDSIDQLPETQNNTVVIFNRWGDEVFRVKDYNNDDRAFRGYNKNGNPLPSGTYFYKISFQNGKKMTGYLEVRN